MAMPDAKLIMVKLEFAYEDEQEHYEDILMYANVTGAFEDKSESMLATLNKAREACVAVKGNPSTKVCL